MNLTGGAGVLPEPLARTIVEDGASKRQEARILGQA